MKTKYYIYLIAFFSVVLLINHFDFAQQTRHRLIVQYRNPQPLPLYVWLDSTAVILDTVSGSAKMPPIVKMIGIADIHRFARITATIGKKSFYLPIGKETHDILIELSDTVQPIRQYRQPIKLK